MQTLTPPAPETSFPTLHSVQECADILHLSTHLIYQLVKSHELPAIRIGHTIRISSESIRDAMLRGTRPIHVNDGRTRKRTAAPE